MKSYYAVAAIPELFKIIQINKLIKSFNSHSDSHKTDVKPKPDVKCGLLLKCIFRI
jgi:hypothetical protein